MFVEQNSILLSLHCRVHFGVSFGFVERLVSCGRMGLLDKLWDDVLAGPQPDKGLKKLRKERLAAGLSDVFQDGMSHLGYVWVKWGVLVIWCGISVGGVVIVMVMGGLDGNVMLCLSL